MKDIFCCTEFENEKFVVKFDSDDLEEEVYDSEEDAMQAVQDFIRFGKTERQTKKIRL